MQLRIYCVINILPQLYFYTKLLINLFREFVHIETLFFYCIRKDLYHCQDLLIYTFI